MKYNTALEPYLEEGDSFIEIEGGFNTEEKAKIIGLFELSKRCMTYSQNTKFLFFKMLRDHHHPDDEKVSSYPILTEMFKINQHCFWTVFHENGKSNQLRINYRALCSDPENLQQTLPKRPRLTTVSDLKDKIPLPSNEACHFLIIFYIYITQPKSWPDYSAGQMEQAEVEHLMPQAWMAHWESASKMTIEIAQKHLQGLIEEGGYPNLDLDEFLKFLSREEGVEFVPKAYSTKAYKNTKTVIEYLGNRWVTSLKKNRTGSHSSFSTKKTDYKSAGLELPDRAVEIGLDHYDEWDSLDILNRSFEMIDTLYEGLSGTGGWDQF